jgi:hypothetical protein
MAHRERLNLSTVHATVMMIASTAIGHVIVIIAPAA